MSETTSLFAPESIIELWQEEGLFRAIDVQLATLLLRAGTSETIAALSVLVSHQVGRGHTCLSLPQLFDDPVKTLGIDASTTEFEAQFRDLIPDLAQLLEVLNSSDSVLRVAADEADALQPLVWDAHRQLLYLRRYWQHEQRIRNWLDTRTATQQQDIATEPLCAVITSLIAPKNDAISWQRLACANAAKQSFSVITGGPGTGKTYTVVRVLATLLAFDDTLRIALAAPTGKAAARMEESVNAALADTDNPALLRVKSALSRKASTLHRLLGSQRHSRYFRHNSAMPLPFDVVVVDEASMIDTEMFDALLDAIGPHTRLILLGDKDQLAPVEAGSILASLCREADSRSYSPAHQQWLMAASGETMPEPALPVAPGLNDHIVMLEGSERFQGAIADLALAVNACDVDAANQALTKVRQLSPPPSMAAQSMQLHGADPKAKAFWQELANGFADFVELCDQQFLAEEDAINTWAATVLSAYSNYQLLTALRAGPWGQQQVNRMMEQLLRLGATSGSGAWYHGRPVMVTSNDYSLNLNNGDIGIVLKHPSDQRLRVVFPAPVTDANPVGVRWVLPSRLDAVETVYAMTVHKSQGSEFRHTVLMLPDRPTPVLTKELIYTGITRAKKDLTLVIPNQSVWQQGVLARIERLGGLG
ncbi:exodeoxyribonuclease V subunit alpha [Alkalimonas sp. MEB108]|uniref:RecBCD enzyme subunit RecD n=1 Tax=Alkalimonas cellulosilytica TaxID=3058395 RepID=A0ABU7J9J9_9GAMM|nr:exodeoxyribonuclease V subunit alpha [Alkalimonas sp. MEB108]MEE2003162.1 exodeoxyribonuclease V subunit alpha [Alkalimonas sp. MEB108]